MCLFAEVYLKWEFIQQYLHFNDGTNGVKAVLSKFGLSGKVTESKSTKHNHERINRMQKKSSEPVKKRRKTLRSIKKGFLDKESEQENIPSYLPGGY